MVALTREPSGSRASTMGADSSTLRPMGAQIRSISTLICSALSNLTSALRITPPLA
jgi:hypothetical protein